MSNWYARARGVIILALAEAKERGLDDAATLRLVDSRYPFGVRENHPYTMWLKARREWVPSVRRAANAKARYAIVTTPQPGDGFMALVEALEAGDV
ncbi:MAG: hypothetical protein WCF99_08720 [Chloroflexales bacterium]